MPYTAPATVVTATTITSAWGNSVKAATDFLANPPACRVYHNTTQSIADNTTTVVTFNSERYDTDTMHDNVTNPERITFNTAGLYVITFHAEFPAGADYSVVYADLVLNGVTLIAVCNWDCSVRNDTKHVALTTTYKVAATNYLTARVYQDNTANTARLLVSGANHSPELTATWIGLG